MNKTNSNWLYLLKIVITASFIINIIYLIIKFIYPIIYITSAITAIWLIGSLLMEAFNKDED